MTTPNRRRTIAARMLAAFLRAYPQYAQAAARGVADALHSGVFWQAGSVRWETWNGKDRDDR